MDKNAKNFISFSILFFFIITGTIAVFVFIYSYSTITTYNYLLLIIITLIAIIMILFIVAVPAVLHTYEKKEIGWVPLWILKLALRLFLPIIIFLSGIFKREKDEVRKIYIEINNILVESENKKYKPEDILVLLPHCLQLSDCDYKITTNLENCRRCGRCSIEEIISITKQFEVKAIVVTGGTFARKAVADYKPKIVLSVACERDLFSGIWDVGDIPVVGLLNIRPNGPCMNTLIDMDLFKNKLDKITIRRR